MVFYEEETERVYFEISKGDVVYKVTYTTLFQELKDIHIVIYDPETVAEIDVVEDIICNMYLPYGGKAILYVRDLNEIITNLKNENHGINS